MEIKEILVNASNESKSFENCAYCVSQYLKSIGFTNISNSCTTLYGNLKNSDMFEMINEPEKNAIIFFSWNKYAERPVDHVGIISKVVNNTIFYHNVNGSVSKEYSLDNIDKNSITIWSMHRLKQNKKTSEILVKLLQSILNIDGENLEIDGKLGNLTENAVNNFVKKYHI